MKKIVLLGMEENIFLREILVHFFARGLLLNGIVLEQGSPRAETMIEYLKNDFYSPPTLSALLSGKNIPLHIVNNINGPEAQARLEEFAPDLVMLGGSSRILKSSVIHAAKIGMINSHPGLLPEYKGRDIVAWAISKNDPIGATSHFVDVGVDTGPILLRREAKPPSHESLLQVRVRVMRLAAELMVESVLGLIAGTITPRPQSGPGKTYDPIPPEILLQVENKLRHS